jgi:predicted enzyme related to lactoylglutathione lyase
VAIILNHEIMKRPIIGGFIIIFASGFYGCSTHNESDSSETQATEPTNQQTSNVMNSFVSIFEIPATEISRAIDFYQEILDIKIEEVDMPGMQMGIFPYEGQSVIGVIVEGEGYEPAAGGITIYLNGGADLQIILSKVEISGGKIVVPKTPHADESGYFAIFLDTEGNKMGLHSPN